jgi:leucyl aminopeptidase
MTYAQDMFKPTIMIDVATLTGEWGVGFLIFVESRM